MPVLAITWHTHRDERTCLFCMPLDGKQWIFHREQVASARLPPYLVSPGQGIVWDLSVDEPRTHGLDSARGPWNCRCWLTYRFVMDDLETDINKLGARVEDILMRLRKVADKLEA